MSSYTSQSQINGEIPTSDLIDILNDDDNPTPGFLNTILLNQVIANSSGEIDQACANIYGEQLPFSPTPLSVANMALTITCYRLYRRRLVPNEQNRFYPEYKRVRDFLDGVNTGKFHLDDVPTRDFPQGAVTGRPILYSGGVFGTGCVSNSM